MVETGKKEVRYTQAKFTLYIKANLLYFLVSFFLFYVNLFFTKKLSYAILKGKKS
jgi:hypothetical protein